MNSIERQYPDCRTRSRLVQFGATLFVYLSIAIMLVAAIGVETASASSSSYTLIWTAPGDDGLIGTATAYDLRYSTDSFLLVINFAAATAVPGVSAPSPAGTEESFTVNNLEGGNVYYFAIKTIDDAGNVSGISNIVRVVSLALDVDDDSELPRDYTLAQNYPNPFNPSTTIEYSVPTTGHVRLTVYNISGQTIATLVDSRKPPGRYEQTWDGTGHGGSQVASGVYFYRLETDQHTEAKKMVLLK